MILFVKHLWFLQFFHSFCSPKEDNVLSERLSTLVLQNQCANLNKTFTKVNVLYLVVCGKQPLNGNQQRNKNVLILILCKWGNLLIFFFEDPLFMKYMYGVEKKGSYMHVNEYGLILHYNRLLFQVCWSCEIEMQKFEVPFLFLKRKKIEIIFRCFMNK